MHPRASTAGWPLPAHRPRTAPSQHKKALCEPSATIVWKTLYRLGIADDTVLWNALPNHPHKPGTIPSNRTPSDAELKPSVPAMRLLVDAFPQTKVIAVAKKAESLLQAMGVATAGAVRHAANGGAIAFAEGLAALVKSSSHEPLLIPRKRP